MIEQQSLLPEELEGREQQDFGHSEELAAFEFALRDLPWAHVYASMVAAGFKWREAAYVAWTVQTKENRVPESHAELATLLGCGKGKIVRLGRDPRLSAMQIKFAQLAYMQALPDIVDASIQVASNPSYKSTPERNNIINKVLNLGTDTLNLRLADGDKGDLSELSDADLVALLKEEDRE